LYFQRHIILQSLRFHYNNGVQCRWRTNVECGISYRSILNKQCIIFKSLKKLIKKNIGQIYSRDCFYIFLFYCTIAFIATAGYKDFSVYYII